MDLEPRAPNRGDAVEVVHYFRVIEQTTGDYDVFLHGDIPGGGGRVVAGDHAPAEGRFLTSRWKAGEIWPDKHRILIPRDYAANTMEIYVGLFKGDTRLTLEAEPGKNDGHDRLRIATINIAGEGVKDDLPLATIARATSAIKPDGVLDEAEWNKAEVLSLSDSMGRGTAIESPTKLRLLWDEQNLYVAFDCVDKDVTEKFSKRDDPIYDHEAVEVFLMPNTVAPALGPYVELQASPGGVIFDASFTARRQGMDPTFNAKQTVGTKIDGTLNKQDDEDRGFVSEWVVPWTSLRGVSKAPAAGDEWRMNAFRIEKNGPLDRPKGEYTAWSPPKVGDFHNVVRFGRMKLAP
jgi:hypothetical protein